MAVGAATGNTSTGLALVREVDPETKSEAGDTHLNINNKRWPGAL